MPINRLHYDYPPLCIMPGCRRKALRVLHKLHYISVQGWRKFYPRFLSAEGCPTVKLFALDWPPFTWRKG